MNGNNVLLWVEAHELPTGGIEAWNGAGVAYPEVTGYLIPTLLDYGERKLAYRLADWLVSIQHTSGAWQGMDNVCHTFDTSAIVEGLEAAYNAQPKSHTGWIMAATMGRRWLGKQKRTDGSLRRNPEHDDTRVYTMRAGWIMADAAQADYWRPECAWSEKWNNPERPHYIAYALEGLYHMGQYASVRLVLEGARAAIGDNGLMPMWAGKGWKHPNGYDAVASAQFAILFHSSGMFEEAQRLRAGVEQMITQDGGIKHAPDDARCISWAAKYYLDLLKVVEHD